MEAVSGPRTGIWIRPRVWIPKGIWYLEPQLATRHILARHGPARLPTRPDTVRHGPAWRGLTWQIEVRGLAKMLVRAQIIKNGPNRIQNRRFGLKIGPEACQDRCRALRTGPATKKSKKDARAALGIFILGRSLIHTVGNGGLGLPSPGSSMN